MPRRPPEEGLPLSDPGPLTVLVIGREQEDRVPLPEEFFRMARLALFHARLNENSPVAVFDA